MSFGVECWNEAGQKTLSITDRLLKIIGVAQVGASHTGSAASGTITDSRFDNYFGTTPFAFIINGGIDFDGAAVQFAFSGNTLTWSFPTAARPNHLFAYGVF
jgi:hypothetical protein